MASLPQCLLKIPQLPSSPACKTAASYQPTAPITTKLKDTNQHAKHHATKNAAKHAAKDATKHATKHAALKSKLNLDHLDLEALLALMVP